MLDVRNIGYISEVDEMFLAELIKSVCNKEKFELFLDTKKKFNWNSRYLIPYVVTRSMGNNSFMCGGEDDIAISSGDWLCGIFAYKEFLCIDYMLLMMCFVNKNLTKNMVYKKRYSSGIDWWTNAPPVMKQILDTIDASITNRQSLKIIIPELVPFFSQKNSESIQQMIKNSSAENLRGKVMILWPDEIIEFL
jgi:hypothetical protein